MLPQWQYRGYYDLPTEINWSVMEEFFEISTKVCAQSSRSVWESKSVKFALRHNTAHLQHCLRNAQLEDTSGIPLTNFLSVALSFISWIASSVYFCPYKVSRDPPALHQPELTHSVSISPGKTALIRTFRPWVAERQCMRCNCAAFVTL